MWRNHTPQSFSGYRETQKFKVGPSINQQKPSIRFCVPLKNLIAVSSTFRKKHTKTAHNQHKLRFPSLLTNVKPPPMDTEDEVWLSITRPRAGSRQLPEAILLRHGPRELRWCWDDDEIFGWFRWELSNFFPPWLFDYTKKGKGVETNLKMGCCCWRWGKAALKQVLLMDYFGCKRRYPHWVWRLWMKLFMDPNVIPKRVRKVSPEVDRKNTPAFLWVVFMIDHDFFC